MLSTGWSNNFFVCYLFNQWVSLRNGRYFRDILEMLIGPGFYKRYVKLPKDIVPPAIHNNLKLWPYFCNCRGSIDGVHFYARVLAELMAPCCNRKGALSQNVLAGSTFDLFFCYILSGWEGSANDGLLFEDAQRKDFAVPRGSIT